jgi:hypothetical protein
VTAKRRSPHKDISRCLQRDFLQKKSIQATELYPSIRASRGLSDAYKGGSLHYTWRQHCRSDGKSELLHIVHCHIYDLIPFTVPHLLQMCRLRQELSLIEKQVVRTISNYVNMTVKSGFCRRRYTTWKLLTWKRRKSLATFSLDGNLTWDRKR